MKKLLMVALLATTCTPMKIVAVKEHRGFFGVTFFEYFSNDWDTGREGRSADSVSFTPVHVGQDVCIPDNWEVKTPPPGVVTPIKQK